MDAQYEENLIFWLNGVKVHIDKPDPTMKLTDYLREVGLTGTKVGCGQGGCGACTVMLSQKKTDGTLLHRPINACLRLLCTLDGCLVTTTEGIGSVHKGLDPTQVCAAKYNGSQCGFCTPGFVMNTHAFLQEHPHATEKDLEDIHGGNLCRCTGYRSILHGMRTLASDYNAICDTTQKCVIDPSFYVHFKEKMSSIDLDALPEYNARPRALHFKGPCVEIYRPLTLAESYRLKKQYAREMGLGNVRVIVGNTASGVYAHEHPGCLIDISALKELHFLQESDSGIDVGAAVSIQELLDFASEVIKQRPAEQLAGLKELKRHAVFIAGLQVRSAGSIAGNICMTKAHANTKEPFPSDLYTIFATLGAKVSVGSAEYAEGVKSFSLTEMPSFDKLPEDAIVLSFHLPFTRAKEYVQTYRIARRVQMAHPIVNAGFRMRLGQSDKIEEFVAVYGGLASLNEPFPKVSSCLLGKALNTESFQAALAVLEQEVSQLTIPMEEEGMTIEYRRQLAKNFFYKFFLHVLVELKPSEVDKRLHSAAHHDERPLSQGVQEFTEFPDMYPLSQSIVKRSAFVQASGEVKYTQDVGLPLGGLHGVMVQSTHAHARFAFTKRAPGLEALKAYLTQQYPGFKDLITAQDIPKAGSKLVGLGDDDPVFSDGVVTSVGAPIAMVVAESIPLASVLAAFIEKECITYEDLRAHITIEDAIQHTAEMPMIRKAANSDEDIQQRIPTITRDGSDEEWLNNPAKPMPGTDVVSGTFRTSSQAHFYMETMSALAIPEAYDQMTVFCSTQNPNGTQAAIARALGIKLNQVSILIEQVGGGFGGKQHRANIVGAQAAVAAYKLRLPVRLVYDRSADMQSVGKRHPYLGRYHVAYTDDGMIKGMRIDLNSDAGDTYDCTFAVLDSSLLNIDQAYFVPTLQANGKAYRTNKASNTAFRTFGVVQAWAIVENAIEHAAFALSQKLKRTVLPEEIRYKNMYRNGTADDYDMTHFGQKLNFCNIRTIWDDLYNSSEFEKRRREVDKFNQENRWRKRGICMVPQKHGIGFTEPRGSLNSSSALVTVNMADASVFIYQGGVEMGQGLYTKLAQLAANVLGIPIEYIRIGGNNTNAIANCPPTAASTGFDLCGGAVERACMTLRKRLEDFCRDLEQFTPLNCIEDWRTKWQEKWKEIVFQAWFQRINLSAAELYKTPHYKGPTAENPRGKPFLYYAYGAAVTEVEIDVLTGEFKILRVDAVCDVNKSPNPAIDIGQLEGGFVQGIGFATTEELIYDEKGRLVTDNIWNYKPPCSKTIPIDFRVKLQPVDEAKNAREMLEEQQAVKSSKSFTESSLTLGASTYIAIKQAVKAARKELTGREEWLDMDLPMTCQRIQMLCGQGSDSLKV